MKQIVAHLLLPASLATAAACTAAYPPGPPLEEPPPAIGPGARLDVLLTDAPGDFDEVWVEIREVALETAAGWHAVTDQPQRFDLLTLQSDVTAALGSTTLAPGRYGQLRVIVDSAYVMTGGEREDLTIASGPEAGIKIQLGAELEADMAYELVLDFDAAESIQQTGQGWLMTPVIEVKQLTGTPSGEPID